MKNRDRVNADYATQRIREVETQLQALFAPTPVPLPKERVIVLQCKDGSRLVRRVIES